MSGFSRAALFSIWGLFFVLPVEGAGPWVPVVAAHLSLISSSAAGLVRLPAGPPCWLVCCSPFTCRVVAGLLVISPVLVGMVSDESFLWMLRTPEEFLSTGFEFICFYPFYDTIVELSGEENVSASRAVPLMKMLAQNLQEEMANPAPWHWEWETISSGNCGSFILRSR